MLDWLINLYNRLKMKFLKRKKNINLSEQLLKRSHSVF